MPQCEKQTSKAVCSSHVHFLPFTYYIVRWIYLDLAQACIIRICMFYVLYQIISSILNAFKKVIKFYFQHKTVKHKLS
jgi:divalent metal cation (Fe/Co/Zn/Cd) transporter